MGILSKLSHEKHPFSKPKTHKTNLSENSSCSLTGSEFLLTDSHSSNSSTDTTGLPMSKANNGPPRRVKNMPIALTPSIPVEKFNFPTTPTKQPVSPGQAGRRKPPPTPPKELTGSLKLNKVQQDEHRPRSSYQSHNSRSQTSPLRPDDYSTNAPSHTHIKSDRVHNSTTYNKQVPSQRLEATPPGPQSQVLADIPPMNGQVQQPLQQKSSVPAEYASQVQYPLQHSSSIPAGSPSQIQYPQQQINYNQHEHNQKPVEDALETDSDEYTSDGTDTDSGEYTDDSEDTDSNTNPNMSYSNAHLNNSQQHPYYEQWMQYYASLAAQQQGYPQMPNRNSMYGGGYPYQMNPQPFNSTIQTQGIQQMQNQAPMHTYGNISSSRNPSRSSLASADQNKDDFLTNYKRRSKQSSFNEVNNPLVTNSRRSTIKSNRYPSVPLSILQNEAETPQKIRSKRVSSLDLNFRPRENLGFKEVSHNNNNNLYEQENQNLHYNKPIQKKEECSIASGILNMTLESKEDQRHISDYNKFLFDDESHDEEEDEDQEVHNDKEINIQNEQNNSQIPNEEKAEFDPNSSMNLTRQESSRSTESTDSIQKEEPDNFKVKLPINHGISKSVDKNRTDSNDNHKKEKVKQKREAKKSKHSRQSSVVDPNLSISSNPDFISTNPSYAYPHHPAMVHPMVNPQMQPMDGMEAMGFGHNNIPPNHHMMAYNTEYQGVLPVPHSRRQSIATADSKRQSMMMPVGGNIPPYGVHSFNNNRMSMPVMGMNVQSKPDQIRTTDSTIRQKVEEFVELRQIIASGNKSLEYRLKWIKMLINATNYRLYAFVNIKGEPVPQEFSQHNKALFIKSSINHLLKLIKEYEIRQTDDNIHSEVCYIYGCLLKQDYISSYNQDFGIEKDIPQAMAYFEKSLELYPNNFKSLYKLGEVFENEFPDQFEEALKRYKEAARLGYNRAIYKMALLYLNVSLIRSTKFFNYFVELSNIDLNSKDVKLTGEDRDELEEIMGLACFQLGKVYEGIYPGDLQAEDEFISKSLERAPVNYAKALTYFNKSAKLGCLLAQVKLGNVYENGDLNRQKNPSKSIQWYMKAVNSPLLFKRHPNAMLGLSRWNLHGSEGLSKYIPSPNPEKAIMWCERAIKEFDSPDACYAMGQLTEMGLGDRNPRFWYSKGQELGSHESSPNQNYA